MLEHLDINRVIDRDEQCRKSSLGQSLLSHAAALLDGQAEAAKAEKSLCEKVRERIAKQGAPR